MFQYTATGTVRLKGCFKGRRTYNVLYRFAEGSVVYRVDKAKRGRLDRVAIKSVRFVGSPMVPMYVDTLNALYAEGDLCTHAEALAYATAYYTAVMADVDAELARLACPPG